MKKKQWRDFESARKFVQSLNLKNQKEWEVYCKLGKKPKDIPAGIRELRYVSLGRSVFFTFIVKC